MRIRLAFSLPPYLRLVADSVNYNNNIMTMATNLPYELKGTLRSGFEVDKAQLKDFRALKSDWREIFRWIMSIAGNMPYYDDNNKITTM